MIDIAGLVKGASAGEGLGNAFLSHVRAVDAIFHVCRAFDEVDVIHVDGEVNPVKDLETIHHELRLKDEEFIRSAIADLKKTMGRLGSNNTAPERARQVEMVCTSRVFLRGDTFMNHCAPNMAQELQEPRSMNSYLLFFLLHYH